MIIERDERDRFVDSPEPERSQVMKIARTVEDEWRQVARSISR